MYQYGLDKTVLEKLDTSTLSKLLADIKQVLEKRNSGIKVYLKSYNKYEANEPVMLDFQTFRDRFTDVLGEYIDDSFYWRYVIIAGGLISGLAESKVDSNLYRNSSIDLFYYFPPDLDRILADMIIHGSYLYFFRKFGGNFYAFSNPTQFVNRITIMIPKKRTINIFWTPFKNAMEVLQSFDLSHCQIGFNGKKLIYTAEFAEAMQTRITIPMKNHVQLYRLVRAWWRGYSIGEPIMKNCQIVNYLGIDSNNNDCSMLGIKKKHMDWSKLSTKLWSIMQHPYVRTNLNRHILSKDTTKKQTEHIIKDYGNPMIEFINCYDAKATNNEYQGQFFNFGKFRSKIDQNHGTLYF